jgi:molybdopterin converting factor subunit 1
MEIRVKLFALLRDRAGTSEWSMELSAGASVATAMSLIGQKAPAIRELLPRIAVAVNREYVKPDHVLNNGDELALIPPVSGGCDD